MFHTILSHCCCAKNEKSKLTASHYIKNTSDLALASNAMEIIYFEEEKSPNRKRYMHNTVAGHINGDSVYTNTRPESLTIHNQKTGITSILGNMSIVRTTTTHELYLLAEFSKWRAFTPQQVFCSHAEIYNIKEIIHKRHSLGAPICLSLI